MLKSPAASLKCFRFQIIVTKDPSLGSPACMRLFGAALSHLSIFYGLQ